MKLLVSDYDRTLKIDDKISKENRDAIQKFSQMGNLFCVNSGRSYLHLIDNFKLQDFDCDYVITGSGSQIFKQGGALLHEARMQHEDVEKLISLIRDSNALLMQMSTPSQWEVARRHEPTWHTLEMGFDLSAINTMSARFDDVQDAEAFCEKVNSLTNLNAFSNRFSVDVAPKGVSKATAITTLANILNIQSDAIYTIGDSPNDYDMIVDFGGSCVAVSHPSIVAVSKNVYEDVAAQIEAILENN